MTTVYQPPECLTAQGYVFTLHNPALEQLPAHWRQELSDSDNRYGELVCAVDKLHSLYWLQLFDVLTISISLTAKTIDLWPEASLSKDTLQNILIGQLVPRILAAQGELVLHGGSVCSHGKAIVFMGKSGVGKSTLAASLYCRGSPLVHDDAVMVSTINSQFFVRAVYPAALRLLPDSLVTMFADLSESTPPSQFITKRRIDVLQASTYGQTDIPLGALFFLGNESSDHISLRKLPLVEAVMAIISNSFVLNPTEAAFNAVNLYKASELAESIPAYALNYPRIYESLPDVHQAIFNILEELQA